MNIKFFTLLVITAFLVGGCGKSPTSTANNSGNQPPAPIQAEAFHGQVYKSFDQRKVLTLISKDECELSEQGTILLCKYTKQDDKLRVVTTALGTSQVLYYRFTNQGLQDNDGNVLFSPEGLLEVQRQVELARKQAAEQARVLAEEQAKEQQRVAARLQESHTPKAVIFSSEEPAILMLFRSDLFYVTKTTVTDVSVTFVGTERKKRGSDGDIQGERVTESFEQSYWFGETGEPSLNNTGWRYQQPAGPVFQMSVPYWFDPKSEQRDISFYFQNAAMSEPFKEAITKARQIWRAKYPDLIVGMFR